MALNQSQDRFNGVVAQLAIKAPCKTVSEGDGNILLQGEQTIGGIAVVTGDRVLLIEQTDPIENGIYNVNTGSWARAADWDGNRDITKGTLVTVNRPTNNLTAYVQVNAGVGQDNPEIGVDPTAFTIFFSQNNSIDDLSDVDLTGCADDDMMHFVGGVLVCTLGQLTYDGVSLLNAGPIGVMGFSNEAPQLRAIQSADLIATINPRRNDQYTGVGGTFGNLDFLHDNNATSSFLGMRLRKQADLFSTRSWNVEGISASTTQTQGQAPVKSSLVRVLVVANADDVITLREPELGMDQVIMNLGANALQIFPASGDDLGFGLNVSMRIQPGGGVWFVGIDANTWHLVTVGDGSGGVPGGYRGCKAYRSAVQLWPLHNTPDFSTAGLGGGGADETAVSFSFNVHDTESLAIHNPGVNPTRFNVPAGVSKVNIRAGYGIQGDTSGGHRHMRIRINGGYTDTDPSQAQYIYHNTNNAPGSGSWWGTQFTTGVINTSPGDYYEVYVLRQDSSGNTVFASTWMELEIVA